MFKRKIKNIVPDEYEFSRSYNVSVKYLHRYADKQPWTAESIDDTCFTIVWANTKKEAIIKLQNSLYRFDIAEKAKAANPDETFTIPPIRKFNDD